MRIQLSSTVALEFAGEFWNIVYQYEVNTQHHRAKGDVTHREATDNYGDLNRCIAALGKYDVSPEVVNKLRKTYIGMLRTFREADNHQFENKVAWSVKAFGDSFHEVKTNKNYRGVKAVIAIKSNHHKNTSGVITETYTGKDHAQVGEIMVNKTVSADITDVTVDGLIKAIEEKSSVISKAIKEAA